MYLTYIDWVPKLGYTLVPKGLQQVIVSAYRAQEIGHYNGHYMYKEDKVTLYSGLIAILKMYVPRSKSLTSIHWQSMLAW